MFGLFHDGDLLGQVEKIQHLFRGLVLDGCGVVRGHAAMMDGLHHPLHIINT
jgi:hypothetical protein